MKNITLYTDNGEIHIVDDDQRKKSEVISDCMSLLESNSVFRIDTKNENKTETILVRPSRIIAIKISDSVEDWYDF